MMKQTVKQAFLKSVPVMAGYIVLGTGFGILMSIYLYIITRCLYISLRADNTFSRLLGGAISLTFFFYIFVNIGMVSGILPVVGVPLPLISYGGTSMVTLSAGFGIIMAIHTHKERKSYPDL